VPYPQERLLLKEIAGVSVLIGLLSDVHGNLSGLRAVVDDMRRDETPDLVVVAGDHVQGGPRPREVWRELKRLGWILIRGNEDEALVDARRLEAQFPPNYRFRNAARVQFAWSRKVVGAKILRELDALPFSHRVATPAGDLLVVHSRPHSTTDYAGAPHSTAEELTTWYAGTGASAIAFGHYHSSFVRPMPFALLVNVASVGLPVHGLPLASYTVMRATTDGWVVQQRHVPYTAADEAAAAQAVKMPRWIANPEEP